jgi:hypothetical protein
LIASTVVVGYGNKLGADQKNQEKAATTQVAAEK